MKHLKRFFILVLCVLPCVAGANVATTAGSNLTAWNSNGGSANNNNWNTMMNSRSQTGSKAKADFGNCNSLILRCAQPKCAACTTMELAKPVVSGCVNSSKDCKKHGDDLVEFIAAQIVASAAEKVQAQQLAQQQAAAQAAAAQSSQQMAQMQQQMAQMQQQMQQQNAQQMAQMQAALDEQKALAAQAQAQAVAAQQAKAEAAAQTASGVTVAQQVAIESGVSEDTLVRQQIGGEILSTVENAEAQLIKLKETMDQVFRYAGCDARGNNCSGPKRVKIFKEKAMQFFDPYDAIADEMYDALETALAVGVDVSDVIMMLSGSCNKWGKYMCTGDGTNEHKPVAYKKDGTGGHDDCGDDGKSMKNGRYSRGGFECRDSQIIPPQDDVRCTLIGMISDSGDDDDTVERNWLSESYDGDKFIRVGCASSALDSIAIFGRRKSGKNRTLDLDTLERIILQDAPEYGSSNRYSGGGAGNAEIEKLKYCALTPNGYTRLRNAVTQKKMPDSKVCVSDSQLTRNAKGGLASLHDHESNCLKIIPAGYNLVTEEDCKLENDLAKEGFTGETGTIIEFKDGRCVITNDNYCLKGDKIEKKN